MNKRSNYILLILLVLMTLPVVIDVLLWYTVTTYTTSFSEAKIEYLNNFPEPVRNTTLLTVISIITGTIAGCGAVILDNRSAKRLKTTAKVLAVINFTLTALHIFSLM
ncbi:hypothetical protein DYBT9275_03225 [Dyadobacter sp. CECT 9275]|uniref:Uncharacterized protein n=1 Tax=Dyadobacter helix TaxID=2822344 RepID=A0A916JD64_9BACT|nr:hypothetical protein [Dyadobacter sp. CECT 9275]CAG5003766.1 hypothetical protein DYBT9275_03225 [Dyadobacter sp. CECT 9275]